MAIPYKNASLLYGVPGTGKTLFGRYIAYKLGLPFCYLNFARVVDSYMGVTSKNIAKAFSYAAFVSRCPVRAEFKPFSEEEKRAMVEKFLSSVTMSISEQEMRIIISASSQREIINSAIQCIAAHMQ